MSRTMHRVTAAGVLAATWSVAAAGGLSSQLLLATAWCSETYNPATGRSALNRVQFRPDGSYTYGGRSEVHSGWHSSHRSGGAAGRWRVQDGELFIDEGGSGFQHVPTIVKLNSSGWPIITAGRDEYRVCD